MNCYATASASLHSRVTSVSLKFSTSVGVFAMWTKSPSWVRTRRPPFCRENAFLTDFPLPGCDASRLRDFVSDYHKQTDSPQKVDDAYCAFVWSVVAQQPEVRVGTAPKGAPEVYIAPQFSKRDKAKSTAEEHSAQNSLTLIPDIASRSLDELSAEHGDTLRIAVDPERSFVAVTGSHIKVCVPCLTAAIVSLIFLLPLSHPLLHRQCILAYS